MQSNVTTPVTGSSSSLPRDVVFDVLSSTRRRYVLHYLRQNGGSTNLRDLSTVIAAWEYDTTNENVTSKQRTRVYTALRQSHLPKMDREGVITFDPGSGDVTLTDDANDLEIYLDIDPNGTVPWSSYYMGLGLGGLVVGMGAWLDVSVIAAVPDALAAVLFGVALIVVAGAQHISERSMGRTTDGPPA